MLWDVIMRKKFIAGNWKMYTNGVSAEALAGAVVKGLASETRVTVAVCPPFPFLGRVGQALKGSAVALGRKTFIRKRKARSRGR